MESVKPVFYQFVMSQMMRANLAQLKHVVEHWVHGAREQMRVETNEGLQI